MFRYSGSYASLQPFGEFSGWGADTINGWGDIGTIMDFCHEEQLDRIDFSAVMNIIDFDDLVANHIATDGNGDLVIFEGINAIILTGISVDMLIEDNFIF